MIVRERGSRLRRRARPAGYEGRLGNTVHLAVGGGKDGNIHVVNRDSMGKFNANNDNAIYQEIDGALGGAIFGMPAYFNGSIFFGPVGSTVKAFPITNAKLGTAPSSQTAASFGYPARFPAFPLMAQQTQSSG